MRGFIVDCFLRASSACTAAAEFFKNCALEVWRNRKPEPLRGRSGTDLIVTRHEKIGGGE
ncbi:hypothetical protein HJB72_28455 [Rhizobium lentis]|uniref:hypothetical protein n=1 Tax=Rhizobium lentis TaxID=1138194 RepID=UPI001C8378F5|nr:hypothetical protein [Rhizobium lentis]MBX5001857.1 hypothetical protein [Rhizobium lentis]